jgi:hypothetical protein
MSFPESLKYHRLHQRQPSLAYDVGSTTFIPGFTYDGMGRRTQEITLKGSGNQIVHDLYCSTSWQILDETVTTTGTTNNDTRNVWTPVNVNALLPRDRSSGGDGDLTEEPLYFTSDANYDVTSVISTAGAVQEHVLYTAYGIAAFTNSSWSASADTLAVRTGWQGGESMPWINGWSFQNRIELADLNVWLTSDPIMAGMNWYESDAGNPINRMDPTGEVQVHNLNSRKSVAGSYYVTADVFLDKPAPKGGGYIVQHFSRTSTINGITDSYEYWEAWYVREGVPDPDLNRLAGADWSDLWADEPRLGTKGQTVITAELKFFAPTKCGRLGNPFGKPPLDSDPATGFSKNGSGHSIQLPSTKLMTPKTKDMTPSWWNKPSDNGEQTATRTLEISWNWMGIGGGGEPIYSGVDEKGNKSADGYPTLTPGGEVKL